MAEKKAEKKAEPRFTTVYHPASGSPREVPTAKVEEWTEQGWRKTKPTK